ncbi:PA14 domain-containing protein [Paenibacillus daejeonensis]|uniref:PA14 domain-containing protein n=1 Tax=Paenibacillus daejeonensis TaxID=135193 RepID=UPI0003664EDE|nr:PA14 domain-containing protein [Paenibacillus daejeonensis]
MKKIGWYLMIGLLILVIGCSGSIAATTTLVSQEATGLPNNQPYEDWRQQEVPFGQHSYYLTPWRAYMDTWDKNKYLNSLGVVFNGVTAAEADATAQVLSEAGIRHARIEVGWGSLSYEDDNRLRPATEEDLRARLQALAKHNIRPLILLNSHSGGPAPSVEWNTVLKQNAASGAREIYLESVEGIVPRYTGLTGLSHMMYPVITAIDSSTGKATLSAPLPRALPKGNIRLAKIKYQPFSGTIWADGKPNPVAQETINGWLKYVATVTSFVKSTLNNGSTTDAGFDVEVWNELSFGFHFLDINNYYNPKLQFSQQPTYTEGNLKVEGAQVIFPLTINYVNNPAHNLPGVRVINGFSNQRPWDNGTEMWKDQDGFSRHYYTGTDFLSSNMSINNMNLKRDSMLDAQGKPLTTPFIPSHTSSFPERWYHAYQTEFVVRDLQPFPGPRGHHHRYAHPGSGTPAEVWMTESNLYRDPFAQFLSFSSKVSLTDPRMVHLMHHIGAKTTLRNYIFQSHKGLERIYLYSAKEKDHSFALLPESFFTELQKNNYKLTESVRRQTGAQLEVISNVTKLMQQGSSIEQPRSIRVDEIRAQQPQIVFKGNGTASAPDRYQAEDLAVLPYQLQHNQFAVGYYIVTRNVTQSWDSRKDALDPGRYDMPIQSYDIKLSNVKGSGAKVQAYDPMTGRTMPVTIKQAGNDWISVQLEVTDYPRFLIIQEDGVKPLVLNPVLNKNVKGAELSFTSNVDANAVVTWGAYPFRSSGAFEQEAFASDLFRDSLGATLVNKIDFRDLPARKSSYRWKGEISPKYSEKYTFIVDADTCNTKVWVNEKLIVEGCGKSNMGDIELKAGQSYKLVVEYANPYDYLHRVALYWGSSSQSRETVSPVIDTSKQQAFSVKAGERVNLSIPELLLGEGVKINLESQGITTTYPRWNYDVKGVIWK